MERYCFLNEKILPLADAKVGIDDIGLLRGYAIYEGLTAINGKLFRFNDHWNRFVSAACALNLNIPVTPEKAEKIIGELLSKNNLRNRAVIKFILTGGKSTANLEYNFENPTFFILAEECRSLPGEIYKDGGKLITYRHTRGLPEYKTTDYIKAVMLQDFRKERGAIEILYTYNGEVLEGAGSNIFIVKNKTLITPAENILKGITRKAVLELANGKYKTEERPILEEELKTADEVFITSSFKDIVPIVKIDDFTVADRQVGPVTKDLTRKFANLINMC